MPVTESRCDASVESAKRSPKDKGQRSEFRYGEVRLRNVEESTHEVVKSVPGRNSEAQRVSMSSRSVAQVAKEQHDDKIKLLGMTTPATKAPHVCSLIENKRKVNQQYEDDRVGADDNALCSIRDASSIQSAKSSLRSGFLLKSSDASPVVTQQSEAKPPFALVILKSVSCANEKGREATLENANPFLSLEQTSRGKNSIDSKDSHKNHSKAKAFANSESSPGSPRSTKLGDVTPLQSTGELSEKSAEKFTSKVVLMSDEPPVSCRIDSSTDKELKMLRSMGLARRASWKQCNNSRGLTSPSRYFHSNRNNPIASLASQTGKGNEAFKKSSKDQVAQKKSNSQSFGLSRNGVVPPNADMRYHGRDVRNSLNSPVSTRTGVLEVVRQYETEFKQICELDQVRKSLKVNRSESSTVCKNTQHVERAKASPISSNTTAETKVGQKLSAAEELEQIRLLARATNHSIGNANPPGLVKPFMAVDPGDTAERKLTHKYTWHATPLTKSHSRGHHQQSYSRPSKKNPVFFVGASCEVENSSVHSNTSPSSDSLDAAAVVRATKSVESTDSKSWPLPFSPFNQSVRSTEETDEIGENVLPAESMDSEYTSETEFGYSGGDSVAQTHYIQISLSSGGISEKVEPSIVLSPAIASRGNDSSGKDCDGHQLPILTSPTGSSPEQYDGKRRSLDALKGAKRFFFGKQKSARN
jgi:hypothetical protein